MKIKKIILVIPWLVCSISVCQENNFFVNDKDTIFIMYDLKLKNKHVLNDIISLKEGNMIVGTKENITFLTESEKILRLDYEKKVEEEKRLNKTTHYNYDPNKFGIKFVHSSVNSSLYKPNNCKDTYYDGLKKAVLNNHKNDSIKFDVLVYEQFRKCEKATSSYLIRQNDIANRNVFIFEPTEEKAKELMAIVAKPIFIYVLDKTTDSSYYFKEVVWKYNSGIL